MSKKKAERTWKNQEDHLPNIYYFIDHLDPQKRLRVWKEQHMNDVVESLTPYNYLTEFVRFMKGCNNLSKCYPNHEELGHIDEIRLEFWAKYQEKVKTVIKPAIKKINKKQMMKDLAGLRFNDWWNL